VQLQVEHGASMDVTKENGWSAIHLASLSGYKEIVSLHLD
jgi:ankyrin repeat protein